MTPGCICAGERRTLPVHGVQGVRLVVVPSLVVANVQGDGRVEGREEVLGCCRQKPQKKSWKLRARREFF